MKTEHRKDYSFMEKRFVFWITAILCMVVIPDIAIAASDTDSLPFAGNVDKLFAVMKGPIPTIISIVGIVGCGGMLIFGGEISGFARALVFLVLVISIIVQAENIVVALGGESISSSAKGR